MIDDYISNARILIVDDEPINVRLLEHMLHRQNSFHVISTTDSREALRLFEREAPDLVLLDIMMPHLNGYDVMQQLRKVISPSDYLPIVVLSADVSPATKQRALSSGAKDFLQKPFEPTELMLRLNNLLESRYFHLQLRDQNQKLEYRVQERTRELNQSQVEILQRLARAADFRDDDTGRHTYRVGRTAALLSQTMNWPAERTTLLERTAPLHDVGKIGISDDILLKGAPLSDEEFDVMKTHTTIGGALLSGGNSELLKMAQNIALTHHERWNGRGYPFNLSGEEIPIEGRIVAIADVFDALTHERPYKKAWPVSQAVEEIQHQSGRHFDPAVVAAFLELPHDSLLEDFAPGDQALHAPNIHELLANAA